jgi:hypothetical protein
MHQHGDLPFGVDAQNFRVLRAIAGLPVIGDHDEIEPQTLLERSDLHRFLDIFISRCILRGSEFGARHANFIEADTQARIVAPARELTVAGSALPAAVWANLRLAQ